MGMVTNLVAGMQSRLVDAGRTAASTSGVMFVTVGGVVFSQLEGDGAEEFGAVVVWASVFGWWKARTVRIKRVNRMAAAIKFLFLIPPCSQSKIA